MLLIDGMIGVLLNIYESVDVLTLIKGGSYDELNLSVGDALMKRPDVTPPLVPPLPLWPDLMRVGLPRRPHVLAARPPRCDL